MSAEADRLDREAQQLDREADALDAVAREVDSGANDVTSIASNARTPFLQTVNGVWIGPQATKFLDYNQKRFQRISRQADAMHDTAGSMRAARDQKREQARRNRDRANQLRREEAERARQAHR